MKTTVKLLVLSTALLATTSLFAAQEVRLRVIDRGSGEGGDGVRFYDIVCFSGERTKVEHYFTKGEACYYPVSNRVNRQCMPSKDVDRAAIKACNE